MNHYIEALNLLLNKETEKAEEELRLALKEEPDNIEIYLKLGDILREKGQFEKATQLHHSLLVKKGIDAHLEKRILQSLSEDYLSNKQYRKAGEIIRKLIGMDKEDVSNYHKMLTVYEEEKNWNAAWKTYKVILKLKKQKTKFYLALYKSYIGIQKFAQGSEDEAASFFKDALKLDTNCIPALLYSGDIAYSHKDSDKAIDCWQRIITQTPHYAYFVFERLEKAYFEAGTFSEIATLYESLREKNPKDKQVLHALARIYSKKGSFDDAARILQEILDIDEADLKARIDLIELDISAGDTDAGIQQLKELSKLYELGRYHRCERCGYEGKEFFFRCPECKEWVIKE